MTETVETGQTFTTVFGIRPRDHRFFIAEAQGNPCTPSSRDILDEGVWRVEEDCLVFHYDQLTPVAPDSNPSGKWIRVDSRWSIVAVGKDCLVLDDPTSDKQFRFKRVKKSDYLWWVSDLLAHANKPSLPTP